jgi:predicted RNase H-like nuclease (RuvC/YqgF family)
MVKMALYIIVSVVFGYFIGKLYSNAKNREIYSEKEQKQNKIISEKNSTIIKLKNELRATLRKVDAINQGYELQSKLLATKDSEIKESLEKMKELNSIKSEHRSLSMQLSQKIKIIDDKDEVITLLEKKINQKEEV